MNQFYYLLGTCLLSFLLLFGSCAGEGPTNELPEVTFKYQDNTLRLRLPAEPDRLNPLLTTRAEARPLYEEMLPSMLVINPTTFGWEPFLVTGPAKIENLAAEPYPGGVSYTYEIRPEAQWPDGKPVLASDVLFSFKALMNPAVPAAAHRAGYTALAGAKTYPDKPRLITLYADAPVLRTEDALNGLNIFPEHIFDPEGLLRDISLEDIIQTKDPGQGDPKLTTFAELFQTAPYSRQKGFLVGAGPYQLEKWEEGQYVSLAKVDSWWGDALAEEQPHFEAYPDSLVFSIIPDNATAVNAIKSELLDVATDIDPQSYDELRQLDFVQEHYDFATPNRLAFFYIGMNNEDPLLADKRTRRALAHIADTKLYLETLANGLGSPVTGPVHPDKPYYNKDLQPIAHDLEQAQSLLRAAGWSDSNSNGTLDQEIDGEVRELELEFIVVPVSELAKGIAQLLKEEAAKVGVAINIEFQDARVMFGESLPSGNFQLFSAGAGADPLDDDFYQLWHTSSFAPAGTNRVRFGNAETDAIIDQIQATLAPEDRLPLYLRFQEILYEEQPMIFLFAPQHRLVISKRFAAEGMQLRPGYDVGSFRLKK
jgi:ABC-type transport system substrate-binding protein